LGESGCGDEGEGVTKVRVMVRESGGSSEGDGDDWGKKWMSW
jgi:hypothetical protein